MSEPTPTSFGLRMLRAASLQADIYEEVEADRSSIGQATLVVLMASLAAGLGAWLRTLSGHELSSAGLPLETYLAVVVLESPLVWLASGALAYMVGVSFLRGPETESDYLEVLRTTGFAFTPGILSAFGWLPDPFGLGALGSTMIPWKVISVPTGR